MCINRKYRYVIIRPPRKGWPVTEKLIVNGNPIEAASLATENRPEWGFTMTPQKENGYTPIAHELLEAFYRCKLLEYERVIMLCIWRKTYGWGKKEDWISNSQFHEETGIPKPHITRTLHALREKKIITKNDKKITINKTYWNWEVEWRVTLSGNKSEDIKVTSPGNGITSPGNKKLPHQVPTKEKKDTITKETRRRSDVRLVNMQNSSLIPEVIKLFESVDPKNKTYYGNKSQRAACEFLLAEYGLAEIEKRVAVLPQTNTMQYFPTITTPCQLKDKWVQLNNAISREKSKTKTEVIY